MQSSKGHQWLWDSLPIATGQVLTGLLGRFGFSFLALLTDRFASDALAHAPGTASRIAALAVLKILILMQLTAHLTFDHLPHVRLQMMVTGQWYSVLTVSTTVSRRLVMALLPNKTDLRK